MDLGGWVHSSLLRIYIFIRGAPFHIFLKWGKKGTLPRRMAPQMKMSLKTARGSLALFVGMGTTSMLEACTGISRENIPDIKNYPR